MSAIVESASFYIMVPTIVSVLEEQQQQQQQPQQYSDLCSDNEDDELASTSSPITVMVAVNKTIMKRRHITMQDLKTVRQLSESSAWRKYRWTYKGIGAAVNIKWWCQVEFCVKNPKLSRFCGSHHLAQDMQYVGHFLLSLNESRASPKCTIYWASQSNAECVVAATLLM